MIVHAQTMLGYLRAGAPLHASAAIVADVRAWMLAAGLSALRRGWVRGARGARDTWDHLHMIKGCTRVHS